MKMDQLLHEARAYQPLAVKNLAQELSPLAERALQPSATKTCEKHGPYVARSLWAGSTHWTGCRACEGDAREAMQKREAEKVAEHTRSKKQAALAHRLRVSGLEGRMLDSTFENFKISKPGQDGALSICKLFVEEFSPDAGGGLWLMGPPGTGKTHLGSAMVSHLIREKEKTACIFSAREIIRMLRVSWRFKEADRSGFEEWTPRTEEEILDHLGMAPLLVLDEVGASFGSEAEKVQLFDIVDKRYRLRRPTVLLSNLTARGIKDALGDRTYDRLRENTQAVQCHWPSHRGG